MSASQRDFAGHVDHLDASIAGWMGRNGVRLLRASLGVVFLWFGALKLFPGLSPAEALAGQTILVLTGGLIKPAIGIPALGIWECLIGIGLLTGAALRLTLALLFVHMVGTATPLFIFPREMFVQEPFVLTLAGQYIVKNIVLVSAAIVVGATVRGESQRLDREGYPGRSVSGPVESGGARSTDVLSTESKSALSRLVTTAQMGGLTNSVRP